MFLTDNKVVIYAFTTRNKNNHILKRITSNAAENENTLCSFTAHKNEFLKRRHAVADVKFDFLDGLNGKRGKLQTNKNGMTATLTFLKWAKMMAAKLNYSYDSCITNSTNFLLEVR